MVLFSFVLTTSAVRFNIHWNTCFCLNYIWIVDLKFHVHTSTATEFWTIVRLVSVFFLRMVKLSSCASFDDICQPLLFFQDCSSSPCRPLTSGLQLASPVLLSLPLRVCPAIALGQDEDETPANVGTGATVCSARIYDSRLMLPLFNQYFFSSANFQGAICIPNCNMWEIFFLVQLIER